MDSPGAHFLLAGDGSDLAMLRGITNKLPVDAYGQILIEIASPAQVEEWDAPPGMLVTHLVRHPAQHRGQRIADAVEAWVAEWIPTDGHADDLPYVLWVGCSSSQPVRHLLQDLSERIEDLHLHHG